MRHLADRLGTTANKDVATAASARPISTYPYLGRYTHRHTIVGFKYRKHWSLYSYTALEIALSAGECDCCSDNPAIPAEPDKLQLTLS